MLGMGIQVDSRGIRANTGRQSRMAAVIVLMYLLLMSWSHGSTAMASNPTHGDPSDSFYLPIIPDTQQYVWNTQCGSGAWIADWPLACVLDPLPPSHFFTLNEMLSMITFIAEMNPPPPYVHLVGDIVEDHRSSTETVNVGECEWEIVDCMMRKLESAGIAWGISLGNHEGCFKSRSEILSDGTWCEYNFDSSPEHYDLDDIIVEFNDRFPPSRWDSMGSVETGSYDPGHLDESESMMYSWHSFDAGDAQTSNKWLIVNIGWFECNTPLGSCGTTLNVNTDDYYPITQGVYEKLDEVIKDHADHSVIIGQHRIIEENQWVPQGYLTYHHLVRGNPNVKLMLCGHETEMTHQHMNDLTMGDRQVHVVMINYQNCTPNCFGACSEAICSCSYCGGGDGYFHLVEVIKGGRGAKFRTYSPWLDQESDEPHSSFDVSFSTPGDVSLDGHVGVDDLLMIVSHWGPCDGCMEDIDVSHAVDTKDLLLLIQNWGH
jgi:hypothetical protein